MLLKNQREIFGYFPREIYGQALAGGRSHTLAGSKTRIKIGPRILFVRLFRHTGAYMGEVSSLRGRQSQKPRKVTFDCVFMPLCGQKMRASMIFGTFRGGGGVPG